MADRAQPLSAAHWLGMSAAALVAALIFGTLALVFWQAGGLSLPRPGDWAAVRFTLLQAALSAGLSVLLAVPVARALARRRFAGRAVLITLMGAPFILPVVVAVLGLLAVFGRAGVVNGVLHRAGLPGIEIYGLQGVILANVFFNLPLAVRLILQGWLAIPAERFRLAASLGFGPWQIYRRLEVPMLAEVVPGAGVTIFLICLTSFGVALTLGGGPGASTVELAIYQAFRFEFDLPRVAGLALMQVVLCGAAALLCVWFVRPAGMGGGLDRRVERWDGCRAVDGVVLMAAAAFLLVPLALGLADGLPQVPDLPGSIWLAAARSLGVAGVACTLSVSLGLALAVAALRMAGLDLVGMMALAGSPVVMGAGLFLALRGWVDPAVLALPLTAVVNAVVALPLVLRCVLPELRGIEAEYGRLADQLGMQGTVRLRLLILPRLRRPIGFAAGLAAALSMGDLGVVALFADPSHATLPMQVYALMGAYRMDQAAGAAVLLAGLTLGLFWLCDRWGHHAEI